VRVGLGHEGFRTIIYKYVGNTAYIMYSRIFITDYSHWIGNVMGGGWREVGTLSVREGGVEWGIVRELI